MRKSLKVYLAGMAGIALAAAVFNFAQNNQAVVRYHQHLEEPVPAEACAETHDDGEFCTHLPIISIETDGQTIPGKAIMDENEEAIAYETTESGETEITVTVTTYEKTGVYHHVTDEADQTSQASFRVRGNSSRAFPKSNYRIKLTDDSGENDRSLPLLGMTSGSEWALHGPFMDKTLLRNYMWMNLSAEVMGYAPNVRFCEVIIDGEYQGVYVLMETIAQGEGRVELTEYEDGDRAFSYIVRINKNTKLPGDNAVDRFLNTFAYYTMRLEPLRQMELLYPGSSHQTDEVKSYVASDLSEIKRYLYSQDMVKDPDSIWDYLDMQSFADYYILQEFLAVNDMFSASTYMYKDVRGKLHIGPAWDYNNALNNFFVDLTDAGFLLNQKGWYDQLMKSESFVNYVISRYRHLREGVLSQESIESYTYEVCAWLGPAIDRNFEVWGFSFDSSQLKSYEGLRQNAAGSSNAGKSDEELNARSYEEAIEMMLEYADDCGDWMDNNIDSLLQYCHASKNANDVFD